MIRRNEAITLGRLREVLRYAPETGVMTWLKPPAPRANAKAGDVAGTLLKGYSAIRVDGRRYYAHRLAWLLMTGRWPSLEIDHIDGNRANNRWSNLREVSSSVNHQNQRAAHSKNKSSGLLGVSSAAHGGFRARISVGGRERALGCFSTAAEAHRAYITAKRELHEGCTL